MGGIVKAVKQVFNPPDPVVPQPNAPEPQAIRDSKRTNEAKKKSLARAKSRSGRQSTILSSERGGSLGAA